MPVLAIAPPPAPLLSPTSPIEVRRRFRAAPPYVAGGRRAISLVARPGRGVVAPCAGTVRFVGAVAGSRPVATIDCAATGLRVTVGGATPSVDVGALVARGARIGAAAAASLTLSVRRPGVGYVDPFPLLQARGPWQPPAVGLARWSGRRLAHPRGAPAERLPAVRLDRLLRTAGPVHTHPAARPAPDRWLGGIGAITGLGSLAWLAVRNRRISIPAPRPISVRR